MLLTSLILGVIGTITGVLSLFWQLFKESAKLEIYAPTRSIQGCPQKDKHHNYRLPQFAWGSDYATILDNLSVIHSKWFRIINKSSIPVTIYSIDISEKDSYLEANKITTSEPFDHNEFRPDYQSDDTVSQDTDYIPLVCSDAKLPLRLEPYGTFEGYIQFRGLGDLMEEGEVKITVHSSRNDVCIIAQIDYSEGDI